LSYWEINSEILKRHYGGLLEELIKEDGIADSGENSGNSLAAEDIKIENSAAGDPTLCVRGIYVHSKHDPKREGQRLAARISGADGAPVVILGFGLGYAAQAAASPGTPVIIVEKHKNLLLKAFELLDFSDFLTKNRLIFVTGGTGEGITQALAIANELAGSGKKPSAGGHPRVIRNRALVFLDENWYRQAETRINSLASKDDVNSATLKRFGKRWVRNLSHNMKAIRDYPGVSRLEGLAGGNDAIPVFLAAAGPSLDKILPLLSEIRSRCIIVAVDTSLRFFVKNGVQPDFVVVADPQFWNSRHLDRCVSAYPAEDKQPVLIAEAAVYPGVLKLPFKKIFLCSSLYPPGAYMENQVDPKGRLAAGGSVATTAWDFCRALGARHIWIAGLDLAFPGLKTHFKGARFEELSNSASTRLNPCETWTVRALRDGFPFKAPCAGGGQVLTDRRLSLYAAWFENNFRKYAAIRNLCLYPDGLAITGLEAAKTDDFLRLPNRRDEIENRLSEAFYRIETMFGEPQEMRKREQSYEKAVSSLKRGLENIRDAALKGAATARTALNEQRALESGVSPDRRKRIIRDIDAITRLITDSDVKEVAGFLFPPEEITESEEKDHFRAYLKNSLRLFSGLAEACSEVISANKQNNMENE
jgi:hypothetical protein